MRLVAHEAPRSDQVRGEVHHDIEVWGRVIAATLLLSAGAGAAEMSLELALKVVQARALHRGRRSWRSVLGQARQSEGLAVPARPPGGFCVSLGVSPIRFSVWLVKADAF
jgi:hypothetical protein